MALKEVHNNTYELHLDDERQKEALDAYKETLKHYEDGYDSMNKFQKGATAAVGAALIIGIFREPIVEGITNVSHKASDLVRTKIFKKEPKWAKPSDDGDITVEATVTDVKEES